MSEQEEAAPADVMEAADAARLYGIPYDRLKNWWTRGKIAHWRREGFRQPIYVSRADIERVTRLHRVIPPGTEAPNIPHDLKRSERTG